MAKKAAKKESPKESSKPKEAAKKAAPKATVEKVAKAEKVDKAEKKEAPAAKEPKEPKVKAPKPPKVSKAQKKEEARVAAADERWADLKEKHGKEKPVKYAMTGQFQANQAIEHPKLGWGFILSNNNDRLEVVFQEGVKILISNFNQGTKI